MGYPREIDKKSRRAGISILRESRDGFSQDSRQIGGNAGERERPCVESPDPVEGIFRPVSAEQPSTEEQFHGDHSRGKQVGREGRPVPQNPLGREVPGFPGPRPLVLPSVPRRAGDPEIGDLHDPVAGHQDISRGYVAVHDSPLVKIRETRPDPVDPVAPDTRGDGLRGAGVPAPPPGQGSTLPRIPSRESGHPPPVRNRTPGSGWGGKGKRRGAPRARTVRENAGRPRAGDVPPSGRPASGTPALPKAGTGKPRPSLPRRSFAIRGISRTCPGSTLPPAVVDPRRRRPDVSS